MKLKAFVHGLAIPVVVAAVLEQNTLVKITGNKTVNKAGAGDVVLGRLLKPAREANGTGTVETRFKERITVKASGAIAAGDRVKMAAADGDGIQRVTKWMPQVIAEGSEAGDSADQLFGVCLIGGADGADVDVLTY